MMHPLLLELNTRCWLCSLSEKTGEKITLANVPVTQFDHWSEIGLTHLWLMGVWTIGPRSREVSRASPELQREFQKLLPNSGLDDFPGSPYAIAKYEVPAFLGGETGLELFREQLNARGIKLVLDFVPNHTGLDHPWLSGKPELFVQSDHEMPGTFSLDTKPGQSWFAHGRDPWFPPWSDTAQLDYRRSDTRAAMIEQLRSIARLCDGVRCDMTMLLLNDIFAKTWANFPIKPPYPGTEFWANAIPAVKQDHPDFLFMAETYWELESRLQSLGFDYTYDKAVYDLMVGRRAADLQKRLVEAPRAFLSASAHFLGNHDEPRIASLFSGAEYRAAVLLMLGLPGARMLYEGQLQGRRLRVPVQFARRPDEPVDADTEQFYTRLLPVLKGSAVGHGKWTLLPALNESNESQVETVFIIQWQDSPDRCDLVVVNFDASPRKCRVRPATSPGGARAWQTSILFSSKQPNVEATVPGNGEHLLELPPFAAQILRFSSPDLKPNRH